MNRNTQIIILHLCVQGLIGGLLYAILFDTISFIIGNIGGLILVATISILLAHLVLSFTINQTQEVLRRGLYWGFLTWFFIAPLILVGLDMISSNNYKRQLAEGYQRESIKAINNLGVTSFTWDPDINQYRIKSRSGTQHYFYVLDRQAHITCFVQTPALLDTLGWCRLTLKEASGYLNKNSFNIFDSLIQARSFKYETRPSFKLLISSKKKEYESIWMTSEGCYVAGMKEGFCITMPIDK